jgi:putative exosortase-associated protein (TIGR04073 family)
MLLAAWVVLLGGAVSLAQTDEVRDPLPEMQILTVGQAVVQGLVHNPDLRAARHAIGTAEGDVISATLLANPDISATYARERARERTKATGAIARSHSHSRDLGVAQNVNVAGARPLRVLQSRAELDRAKADIAAQEIDLVRNIKHSMAENIGNGQGTAQLHNAIFGAKPLMWEMTKGHPEDQDRAKMAYQDMQQETRNDRQERMEVESELNTWLGFPPQTRVLIQDTLEPQPVPVSYEDLRNSIMSRNPDVRTALAAVRSSRYALKLAMLGKVPDLSGAFDSVVTREVTPDTVARAREKDFGLGMTFPLFDQNQGGIHSAKAQEEMDRDTLTATQWDLENELFKLYQDLNMMRVRIRSYEFGYLARMHTVVYETDLAAYDAKTIGFATWEQDLKRYHVDFDSMLSLKITYKFMMADLEFLAGGSFTAPVQVPAESPAPESKPANYACGLGRKVGRGVSNILLSPVEVPASICGNICDRGVFGVIVGPFDGVLTGVERIGAGALDVFTSPVPWPLEGMESASEPVWDMDPWCGSWSLRYFHPAFQSKQEHFHPAYSAADESTEGGK